MANDLKESALRYHRLPRPGKLEIRATKPLANQRDLGLAYSPGVAAACEAIVEEPLSAADYTVRGNLVGVVTNGTAVLGLGGIGALAAKPVMEGKAVLFKEFADIDVFDIEIDERDPEQFIETVARLEPTFGGINLEDIKAPECFVIEAGLRERMKIPVFHDDQHGTAIVVAAAVLNGLQVVEKDIAEVRLVTAGAGAAALACLDLLVELGMRREHIIVCDQAGVVYEGRGEHMDPYKSRYCADTSCRSLQEALAGADIFLGLSTAGVLKPEWLPRMAERPLVFALANPTPEVMPEEARAARPDAILATGRTDYPNQVNNVLCFPFLFRGALDCGATEINLPMKIACVHAIAELARAEASDVVRSAYGAQSLSFGRDLLIPKPFDPRLLEYIAPAVAEAAMESGVASRPIEDLQAYREQLQNTVFGTTLTMKPVFERARETVRRVVYVDGEQDKVLQVARQAVEQGIARPMLIGRPDVIAQRVRELGIRLRLDRDVDVIDPKANTRLEAHSAAFYERVQRRGYSPAEAEEYMRSSHVILGATLVNTGDADAMICGLVGRYLRHLQRVRDAVGYAPRVKRFAAMNALVLRSGPLFIADTYVQEDPGAADIAEITQLCAQEVRNFGIEPKVALLSYSNFGSHDSDSARKMQEALRLVIESEPTFEVDGEMHADLALVEDLRRTRFPGTRINGSANLLIMPNQDAANIAFNLLKVITGGVAIGPILLGAAKSVHVVTPTISVRGLLNMTALAAVRAN
jgi:malate dehydrogenase (oxaloacetate-decarboxylating)(NADP+)